MQLSEFPYRTTNGLRKYSKLVTKAIASFNWDRSSMGKIVRDPYDLRSNEDRLEYWELSNKYVAYGRYLLFKKNKGEEIKFWTGLCLSLKGISFGIWFKETDVLQYIGNLQKKPFPDATVENGEVWIPMGDTEFEKYCNTKSCAYRRRQILKKFWFDVLGVLQ